MGHKTTETTHNISKAFGPWTANECTVQGWFKFCKGDESLKDEEPSDWPSKIDIGQLGAVIKAGLLNNYTRSCPRTQRWQFYGHLAFERKVKKLASGCLMSWLKIKTSLFWCAVFFCSMGKQQTIVWSICDMGQKSGFYTTTSNNQLSGWTEKKLQSTS